MTQTGPAPSRRASICNLQFRSPPHLPPGPIPPHVNLQFAICIFQFAICVDLQFRSPPQAFHPGQYDRTSICNLQFAFFNLQFVSICNFALPLKPSTRANTTARQFAIYNLHFSICNLCRFAISLSPPSLHPKPVPTGRSTARLLERSKPR